MAPLIKPNTCRTCKFKEVVGVEQNGVPALECRRYPPIGGPILVPIQQGMASIQIHTAFPKVFPDFWCGEFVPQLAVASNALQEPARLAA